MFSNGYTQAEDTELVAAADALFVQAGFGKPTPYRSGGWIADLGTLRALAAKGHLVDTTANDWERLQEWEGQGNGALRDWNQQNWSSIDERSQPYWPTDEDILVAGTPLVGILEVPDNGILADYVEADEMIDMLERNWDGGGLEAPTADRGGAGALRRVPRGGRRRAHRVRDGVRGGAGLALSAISGSKCPRSGDSSASLTGHGRRNRRRRIGP